MARRAMIQQLCAQARTSKETVSGAQQPCWLYSRCNEYKQAEKSLHRHVTDDVRVGWIQHHNFQLGLCGGVYTWSSVLEFRVWRITYLGHQVEHAPSFMLLLQP